jgi:eukaryotic-like serine/threonine-protein kinase
MTGQTILQYEILEKLGEGGMGVVYKARDTRLDRFVALKVLPSDKVSDSQRLRRFTQEAKTASSLNHTNIVTIHDVAGENGAQCIVMEYVRGRTLDQLIPRAGMRLGDALKIAVQIADALAAAAAAGVIHRDVKPGNVMVTDAGLVKVLDFGLAKLASRGAISELDATQTIGSGQPHTVEGTILGTVSYMSPEQAEGKPLDTRSDIFSFGAVLYKMLTGQRAFQGETQMSTLASILNHDPKAENLPREAERILARCLRKDPARRCQTMADLKVALEELKDEAESGSLIGTAPVSRKRTSKWPWVAGAVAILAAVVVWLQPRTATVPAPAFHVVPLTTMPGFEAHPSFSPDGNQVAFDWSGEKENNTDIYVKIVGAGAPVRLTTDPAPDFSPAWSPDGRWIAFLRALEGNRASVRLIAPLGGPERELATTAHADPRSATSIAWTPDAKWLAITDRAPGQPRSLALLSVESGEKRMLPALPTGAVGVDFSPAFSPDGRMLAFARSDPNSNGLYVLELTEHGRPKGEPKRLDPEARSIRAVTSTAWTPDGREILYTARREGDTLWRIQASTSAAPERIAWAGDNVHHVAIAQTLVARRTSGYRLAFATSLLDEDIWRYEIPGPGRTPGAPASLIAST